MLSTGLSHSTPFAAKANALTHAILLAIDLYISSVIFEGYSLSVIKKMNSTSLYLSFIGALICEAKRLVESFYACCFIFVDRVGNHSVHALTRDSSLNSMDIFWIEEVPSNVESALTFDQMNIDPL
ncbi:hypothetical protein V6N13_098161 [Hibiscus sabdariffa]|uniref:RNase H type-1 domain-containing protein n=1 Tax=Hibiscus sabdariffa TaxID=183260 RepID=A0ABR2ECY1_9ROSI